MNITKPQNIGAFWWLASCLLNWNSQIAIAQVTPDPTLPNRTSVSPQGDVFIINGGTTQGGNLFHSFSQFSVPTNSSAFFDNALGIENIIGRITGESTSTIDGILRANGAANLFLINPNGIKFGANAELQIGGSFLSSTASSVLFEDGYQYSSQNPSSSSLLTNSVPIGLGFLNPGEITVSGSGSNILDSPFGPFLRTDPSSDGLRVQAGKFLALVGGDISLLGGLIGSPSGTVELGSVEGGIVRWSGDLVRPIFDYTEATGFRDIQLGLSSLVDASGIGGGSINLQGRNIGLADGSILLIQNYGTLSGDSIRVNASNSLAIDGFAPNSSPSSFIGLISGIYSETLGNATGADLVVSAPQVVLTQGSIGSTTYGEGRGGSIDLTALNLSILDGGIVGTSTASSGRGGNTQISSRTTLVSGSSPFFPESFSAIVSNARGSGTGGDTTISGRSLTVSNRGSVGTNTLGPAKGGDVRFNLTEQIHIAGGQMADTPSNLTSSTFGSGTAGSLFISTPRLFVADGGLITAATYYRGDAGQVFIDASQLIQVDGGSINSGALATNDSILQLLGISPDLSGDSGSISITSPSLRVINGGSITVENNGRGREGNISINSRLIGLDDGFITTSASDEGNGGNIGIDSELIALVNGSQISANSLTGSGGQVTISTTGLFQDLSSTITATSAAGPELDGTVDIQAPDETIRTDTEVTSQVIDVREMSAVCVGGSGERSAFVVTGRGGLPRSPSSIQQSYSGWRSPSTPSSAVGLTRAPQIVEAQGWVDNGDGTVNFTAQPASHAYASARNTACVSGAG